MTTRLFYLLSLLPPLPALGEKPGTSFADIQRLVSTQDSKGVVETVRLLVMEEQLHELTLRKLQNPQTSLAAAYEEFPDSVRTALNHPNSATDEDLWLTEIWSQFFQHALALGQMISSGLLTRWATWEADLRRQFVMFRLSQTSDATFEFDHQRLIESWKAAENPMVGERLLDEARWSFIEQESRQYSFELDECIAYLLKLRLLVRYEKLDRALGVKILEEVTKL